MKLTINEWGEAKVVLPLPPAKITELLEKMESGEIPPDSRIWDFDEGVWMSVESWWMDKMIHWGVGPDGLTIFHVVEGDPLDGTQSPRWGLDDHLVVATFARHIINQGAPT